MRQRDGAQGADGAADFDEFLEISSAALGTITEISSQSGYEIQRYWKERESQALQNLFEYIGILAAILVAVALCFFYLKSRVVDRIAKATQIVTKVANGDLDATLEKRRGDLREISALNDALERFRRSLKSAHVAEVKARTDHLTGLPNRRDLEDVLSTETDSTLNILDAILYIDLDEFKPINDTFGHEVGDWVLKQVAQRLVNFNARSQNWRIGGDEFVHIVTEVENLVEIKEYAERLHQEISQPIRYRQHEIYVGASIGVAIREGLEIHAQDILSRADMAMFTAKQRPVDKVEVYLASQSKRPFDLRQRREISHAIQDCEFFPVFQPQYCIRTGKIFGFEALARWLKKDGAIATPAEFLPIIEKLQITSDLDLHILSVTLEVARKNFRPEMRLPRFSVNMSEETLASPHSRQEIVRICNEYDDIIPHLTIEVTEDALTDRSAASIRESLAAFYALGVQISMDDFGTGYGSFRHLREYSFHEVKIDKSFVQSCVQDKSSHVIIEGFISIANGLDSRVVAEGVETDEQFRIVRALGCHVTQGFLHGGFVRSDELGDVLAQDPTIAA